METLYLFTKHFKCVYNPYHGNGFVRYKTRVPEKLAKEINTFAYDNGYAIKATHSNVFHQVIVEEILLPEIKLQSNS